MAEVRITRVSAIETAPESSSPESPKRYSNSVRKNCPTQQMSPPTIKARKQLWKCFVGGASDLT